MSKERLVTMANQIGDFFGPDPDPAEARKHIADHLKKFWALSMRKEIIAHLEDTQALGAGLDPIVNETLKEYRTTLLA
jgi:formate dehydrogenase subunit delta